MTLPKEWEIDSDWNSHRPLLWLALEKTGTLPIVEFGCGYGSTPLLVKYATNKKRMFNSYETNPEWAGMFKDVQLVDNYNWIDIAKSSFLFIDCAPGEIRKEIITLFGHKMSVVVIHDSEKNAEYVYGLSPILSTFKYRIDYHPVGMPSTTAISNFIDVSQWETDLRSISSMIADEPNGTSH